MQSVADSLSFLTQLAKTPPLSRLSEAFVRAGYELSLVGGPVRDAFLGRVCHDLDLTTNATPDQILRVIKPIAESYWEIGRAFGTIGAKINGKTVEITTYRSDVYDQHTRQPVVTFDVNLVADLSRRDFTINALAVRLPDLVLVDPCGGIDDLFAQTLRTPSQPEVSFGDDPLRMLRVIRFTAQLDFSIHPETLAALHNMAERITMISAERVNEELSKLLHTAKPRKAIELMVDCGLAHYLLPEVPALRLEVDEHHHHKDVYQHSLTVLDQAIEHELHRNPGAEPDLVLRLAALLHDVGKPATRRYEPNGQVSFHHHDVVGAKLVKKRLRALRFDNSTISDVSRLVELHLRFFGYSEGAWTDSAVRRYVRDAGDLLERLHILVRADVTTRNRRKADRLARAYDDLERRIVELAEREELASVRPELDGEQIMRILGLAPGKEVGQAYRFLLELRLDEGILGSEEVTKRLLAWWDSRG